MAQVPAVSQSRYNGLYGWLADREQRAVAVGGVLIDPTTGTSYDGTAARLAVLRAREPVDIQVGELPPWARIGGVCHWWRRAIVTGDRSVMLYDDDGSRWLAENGL